MHFRQDRDFAGGEIIGDRKQQEDYHAFLSLNDGADLLAVLSDGMGGHEAGEVASREAVEAFLHCFKRHPAQSIPVKMGASMEAANRRLADAIRENPGLTGMGCTLLAAHVSLAGTHWISVGDSILSLVRSGKIRRLNEDHSMAPEIDRSLRAGKITAEEAASHPHRNALRSALLGDASPELIDSPPQPIALQKGDVLILASDGIETLNSAEIANLIKDGATAIDAVNSLLRMVTGKARPRQDNTTVQIIRFDCAEGTAGFCKNRLSINWLTKANLILAGCVMVALATFTILWAFNNYQMLSVRPIQELLFGSKEGSIAEPHIEGAHSISRNRQDHKQPEVANRPRAEVPTPTQASTPSDKPEGRTEKNANIDSGAE